MQTARAVTAELVEQQVAEKALVSRLPPPEDAEAVGDEDEDEDGEERRGSERRIPNQNGILNAGELTREDEALLPGAGSGRRSSIQTGVNGVNGVDGNDEGGVQKKTPFNSRGFILDINELICRRR